MATALPIKIVGHPLAVTVTGDDLSNFDGPSTVSGSSGLGQRNPVGLQALDDAGNVYIYLPGVASLAQGDFVIYQGINTLAGTATVTRMLNDANTGGAGQVAMSCSAAVATCFGWFQIFGLTAAIANIATVAFTLPAALYRSGTTARLSTSTNAKDAVFGAFTGAASVSNVGQALLNYPFVMDQSTL